MRSLVAWSFIFCCSQVLADPQPYVHFVANKNQWRKEILFSAAVRQGRVNFLSDKIQFVFYGNGSTSVKKDNQHTEAQVWNETGHAANTDFKAHLVQVSFLQSNPNLQPAGRYTLPTLYNYYRGNDRSRWASGVPAYTHVYYSDVYDGISLLYYSQGQQLKYEWNVAPGSDPKSIRMLYEGAIVSMENDNLYFKTTVNEVWEMKPFAYQWKNGVKVPVACEYVVRKNVVGFTFPEGYDSCEPLIIDPILVFSAYSGSSQDNWGNTAANDSRGNVYSGGMVVDDGVATDKYPVTPGAYQEQFGGGEWDVGILKYDSSGSKLLYCTYLGGNGTETPQSLVVDKDDELLVLGATSSSNFPVTNGSTFKGGDTIDPLWGVPYEGTDIFIAKLKADGSALLGATYIGGSENDGVNFIAGKMNLASKQESPLSRNYGDQLRGDIITDQNNFVYIASNTLSTDFPIVNSTTTFGGGSHDAVVVKFKPDLSAIVWSRYIGGGRTDIAYSIKLDADNRVFVAGGTASTTLPGLNGFRTTSAGGIDGWVMSLGPDGNTIDGTMIGTTAYDQCYFVDLDGAGNVFVYGQTMGNYPVTKGVYSNPHSGQFIQMLSHNLKDTLRSMVIGTGDYRPNISPTAFLVSDCGYIYLSGWGGRINATTAWNGSVWITRNYIGGTTEGLPITKDAYQPTTSGDDFYLAVLSYDFKRLLYSTFLGGTHSPTHVDGGTSRFDKRGTVYHAVCAGCGGFSDFPAVNVPPDHQTNNSSNCNNAVFKFDLSLLEAKMRTNNIHFDNPGLTKVCMPDTIVFENFSFGGNEYYWDLGDGTTIMKTDRSPIYHQYKEKDKVYTVWLKAIDKGTCKVRDSVSVQVAVYKAEADIQPDDELCKGSPYTLQASGGDQYLWRSSDGRFTTTDQTPTVQPMDTTLYLITVTETNGCTFEDSVQLNVIPLIDVAFDLKREGDCADLPAIHVENKTDSLWETDVMRFDFGDGTTSDAQVIDHVFEKEGVYTVKLIGAREGGNALCVAEESVSIPIYSLLIPNVITPSDENTLNDVFFIQYGNTPGLSPADFDLKTSVVMYNRWGGKVLDDPDYHYNWSGDNVNSGIYYFEVTVEGRATCKGWLHVMK